MLTVFAPAKINLDLKVSIQTFRHPLRPGEKLHHVTSTMLKIPLSDELKFEKVAGEKITMSFSGPYARKVPNNSQNLIFRTAKLFFTKLHIKSGLNIQVMKNIPLRSGLGGASSDAAATFQVLRTIFPEKAAKIPEKTWQEMAFSLGSDVPFFFQEENIVLVSGFGEKCAAAKLKKLPGKWICLAMLPKISCESAWAYAELDTARKKNPAKEFTQVNNDFEIPIFAHFPDLQNLCTEFKKLGSTRTGLTGSGSTVFAFFETEKEAQKAEASLAVHCAFWQKLLIER